MTIYGRGSNTRRVWVRSKKNVETPSIRSHQNQEKKPTPVNVSSMHMKFNGLNCLRIEKTNVVDKILY